MQLSKAERHGLGIGLEVGEKCGDVESQAVGKLFSEKPGYAKGMEISLGQIWCPRKGICCKDLGGNTFLFTFLQASRKQKALDNCACLLLISC